LEIDLFGKFLIDQKITHLHATPSFLENLNETKPTSLKRVIAGGDYCKRDLADHWKNKVAFYNEYGPTETTVTAIEYHVNKDETGRLKAVPIGKPLANTRVYILNAANEICPIGVSGELCIGGDCLARGYLNRPDLTEKMFVPTLLDLAGERMYRTGDIGCWLPDGNILYQGRMDEQVKVRGYRIEPGEIENVLQESGYVQQSCVLAREDKSGNRRLIGFVVPKKTFDRDAIQAWLKIKLPEYMVPALWVEMEALPLTSNGKVDKKALPDPDASELVSNEYIAPRNELESSAC
jgi:acyl-CoA synthetase (AMP-forming)/AMP-acid ligase II